MSRHTSNVPQRQMPRGEVVVSRTGRPDKPVRTQRRWSS